MAKKEKVVVNEAQKAFILANCQTHDEGALIEATGLDLETVSVLRAAALKEVDGGMVQKMTKLTEGVFAMNLGASQRIDDAVKMKNVDPSFIDSQRKALADKQASYIHKIK